MVLISETRIQISPQLLHRNLSYLDCGHYEGNNSCSYTWYEYSIMKVLYSFVVITKSIVVYCNSMSIQSEREFLRLICVDEEFIVTVVLGLVRSINWIQYSIQLRRLDSWILVSFWTCFIIKRLLYVGNFWLKIWQKCWVFSQF